MQFIQHGRTYINVNRIVRIEAEEKQYTVIWMNELNTPETVRVRRDDLWPSNTSCQITRRSTAMLPVFGLFECPGRMRRELKHGEGRLPTPSPPRKCPLFREAPYGKTEPIP